MRSSSPQQHGDRVLALRALQTHVSGLGAGGLELCLGLGDIRERRTAAVVQVLRQLERFRVIIHGLVEQQTARHLRRAA